MAQKSSKLIREFSSGGIIFKDKNQVLLIQNSSIKNKKITYWGFPKGHINPGEKSPDAAKREVREETGIEVEIIDKIGDSKYVYTRDGVKIFKVVIIFLMKYMSGDPAPQEGEILDVRWFAPEEALKILSFSHDRELLKKALEMVESC